MLGGIQPSEAARLSMYEFTAMRTIWNRRHDNGDSQNDNEPLELPDADFVRERHAALKELWGKQANDGSS